MLNIVLGLIALWISFLMWERFMAFRYLIGAIVVGIALVVGNDLYQDYRKREKEKTEELEQRHKIELREEFKKKHPEYRTKCDDPNQTFVTRVDCLIEGNDSLVDEAIQAEKDGKPLPKPEDPMK